MRADCERLAAARRGLRRGAVVRVEEVVEGWWVEGGRRRRDGGDEGGQPHTKEVTLLRTAAGSAAWRATKSACTQRMSSEFAAAAAPARERKEDGRRARSGGDVSTRWMAAPRPRQDAIGSLQHTPARGSCRYGPARCLAWAAGRGSGPRIVEVQGTAAEEVRSTAVRSAGGRCRGRHCYQRW